MKDTIYLLNFPQSGPTYCLTIEIISLLRARLKYTSNLSLWHSSILGRRSFIKYDQKCWYAKVLISTSRYRGNIPMNIKCVHHILFRSRSLLTWVKPYLSSWFRTSKTLSRSPHFLPNSFWICVTSPRSFQNGNKFLNSNGSHPARTMNARESERPTPENISVLDNLICSAVW